MERLQNVFCLSWSSFILFHNPTCAGPPAGNAVKAFREIVMNIKESNAARRPSGRADT